MIHTSLSQVLNLIDELTHDAHDRGSHGKKIYVDATWPLTAAGEFIDQLEFLNRLDSDVHLREGKVSACFELLFKLGRSSGGTTQG